MSHCAVYRSQRTALAIIRMQSTHRHKSCHMEGLSHCVFVQSKERHKFTKRSKGHFWIWQRGHFSCWRDGLHKTNHTWTVFIISRAREGWWNENRTIRWWSSMPAQRQEWAAVIKSYYVILTVSLISIGLWAHCVGSNAHVMSEIEIAGQGISVWRIRYCGSMWWFIFKNTFRRLEKDKMAAQELYSVPSIYFSRPGGRCIVSGAQFLCIKMTTIIIAFNLICHHSFYLLKIYWNRWWVEIWTWRTKGSFHFNAAWVCLATVPHQLWWDGSQTTKAEHHISFRWTCSYISWGSPNGQYEQKELQEAKCVHIGTRLLF